VSKENYSRTFKTSYASGKQATEAVGLLVGCVGCLAWCNVLYQKNANGTT